MKFKRSANSKWLDYSCGNKAVWTAPPSQQAQWGKQI